MVLTMPATESPGIIREFMTKQEFADILGVSVKTVSNMMDDGRIGFVRLGKVVRIHRSEIERLAKQSRIVT